MVQNDPKSDKKNQCNFKLEILRDYFELWIHIFRDCGPAPETHESGVYQYLFDPGEPIFAWWWEGSDWINNSIPTLDR